MTSIRDICIDFLAECDESTDNNGYVWDELERYLSTEQLAEFVCILLGNNPRFRCMIDADDYRLVFYYACLGRNLSEENES